MNAPKVEDVYPVGTVVAFEPYKGQVVLGCVMRHEDGKLIVEDYFENPIEHTVDPSQIREREVAP